MKKFILILAVAVFSACTAMYFPTSSAYSKNSIYYTSVEEVNTSVSDTLVYVNEESYEVKLHKFDSPTYTVELNLTPWYPTYYRKWNGWCLSPFIYENIYWSWSWRPHYYYDYWGYYNPYRYSYRYYYPYRSYWDWHRPYYTYNHHKPSHRLGRDVYYTRRGGMSGPTPTHRTGTTSRPKVHANEGNRHTNRGNYSRSTTQPTRRTTVSRSSSQPRHATTSRKTNVRYNSARPVSRSQSQIDRTGYSKSTTNSRSSNTGRTYYNNGPSQRTQPSVRYSERSTSSQNSGVSHSSSSGSSTRRK